MTTTEPTLEDDVREFLCEHWRNGNRYLKIKRIATAIDEDSRSITPVVRDLVHDGPLEVWNDPGQGAKTFRLAEDPRPVWEQRRDQLVGGEGEA